MASTIGIIALYKNKLLLLLLSHKYNFLLNIFSINVVVSVDGDVITIVTEFIFVVAVHSFCCIDQFHCCHR